MINYMLFTENNFVTKNFDSNSSAADYAIKNGFKGFKEIGSNMSFFILENNKIVYKSASQLEQA